MIKEIKKYIKEQKLTDEDKIVLFEEIKEILHNESPLKEQPVDRIKWVDINNVSPNDYNPNSVAKKEMGLLYTSILHDGYTQPVVTIYDELKQKYIIIDGFHRYFTCKSNKDILERNKGRLPVVVLNKNINDRMASTVRHNRARGMHSVTGMSSMVFDMLENGWEDVDICNELGMSVEELVKLKHITGFSKLFENKEYSLSWQTKNQILQKNKYNNERK